MSIPRGLIKGDLNANNFQRAPFAVFQSHPDDFKKFSQRSKQAIQECKSNCESMGAPEDLLSRAFFHPKNVELIINQIVGRIYKSSGGKYLIEIDSDDDLRVIMRSVFIQHNSYFDADITQQIRNLNRLVADQVIPDIASAINAQSKYMEDVFGPMNIMDRPINPSITGTKTLPSYIQ